MKKSSEKTFGILFFVIFLIISIWPLLQGSGIRLWALFIAIIFLTLVLLKPKLLKPLNITWIKFGEMLGKIIAPIVMGLIFFVILTPISLVVRIFGKDLLKLKMSSDKTYWTQREKNITTMDRQF